MSKNIAEGFFERNKTIIDNKKDIDALHNKGFGEKKDSFLVLDLFETMYLIENKNLKVIYKKDELPKNAVLKKASENLKDNKLTEKYKVYKDIRAKGFIVKTGLKFGFDFRVYPKGKKAGEGHSKYVVEVIPEEKITTNEEIARIVRMASGLKTKAILAIVDNDLDISYFNLERFNFK
jgi:tRNA-intron endonuclease, archaea type